MASQDDYSPHPAAAISLHEAISSRHSTREFLGNPVPQDKIHRALALATQSPSNSNVQPWRLWILSGTPLATLKTNLMAHASSDEEPQVPPLPAWAAPFRSNLGRVIYGVGWAIPRDDIEARRAALLRNYEFFGAPVGAIVCIRSDLGGADSLSVGMYLQTLVLALKAEGLDTCVQVSIAGYPEVVKKTVGIPDDMTVLCGMAVGYQDPEAKINTLRPDRVSCEETTVILSG